MRESSIVLTRKEFGEELEKVLGNLIIVLTKAGYEVLVRDDSYEIYVLEIAYDPNTKDYGADRFMLVTCEEEEDIAFNRENKENTEEED